MRIRRWRRPIGRRRAADDDRSPAQRNGRRIAEDASAAAIASRVGADVGRGDRELNPALATDDVALGTASTSRSATRHRIWSPAAGRTSR
jgi:hypothetical protein